MAKKLIVANWKLNPGNAAGAKKLFADFSKVKSNAKADVVVCPPAPYLALAPKRRSYSLGAQDAFWVEKGPFTGEISSTILKSLGAEYVIIGHSERRGWLSETDEIVNKKVEAALRAGMKVILCVGEPGEVRRTGLKEAYQFVEAQVRQDLAGLMGNVSRSKLVVAYEPIWAISTSENGEVDKPEDAAEMIGKIKALTGSRCLYGGSVNSKNAGPFLKRKEIDGALVGGASLNGKEFASIISTIK